MFSSFQYKGFAQKTEINEIEIKKKSENLKPSSWLFEQINTTDKPLVRKRNQKLSILRMKRGIIFIYPTNINKIMRKY